MSDDTRLAFAHPVERATATAADDPLDRISLRDHLREVDIGAFQAERGHTQRIKFNVVVEVIPLGDLLDDNVDRILSYDTLIEAIDHELAAERLNLLETLAARVADRILLDPRAARVFVRVEKLDRGPFALGVEIVRSQKKAPVRVVTTEAQVHPRVVFLSNEVIAAPDVTALVDALAKAPTIICVGQGPTPVPQVGQALAQRRVNLLAIEQNAWDLAARDPRCVVVNSRTEIDWGMKNGQLSVWAPSRIVLDAPDAPGGADGRTLAGFCARLFEATETISIGAAPIDGTTPGRSFATLADAMATLAPDGVARG